MNSQTPSGIAIVGMSGRFPGARNVEEFWRNIQAGKETVSRFDPSLLEVPIPEGEADYVCAKGILDDVDMFDARFFGYLPREAEVMDPQHRVFLEICWEAMEQGGYDTARYPGAVGVFAGCYMDTYLLDNLCSDESFRQNLVESIQVGTLQTELGNDKDYLATRVAFKMGLRGPAMTLQTACSTSLVAIVTACQSLETYGCDMALAGGVTIVLPQYKGYTYKEGGMLSPDGHCRPFDADAAGTVFSNGAAVLLLKRLEDALEDGDTIYSVIKGYATNNDGATKLSYTAPSVDGQAEVISTALGMADVSARSIGYVEAHGTATPLGDPIEIAGLSAAYREDTTETEYCALGSVKANLGHLDISSGAIGLIKTSLLIHHDYIPALTHYKAPNPNIDFSASPFFVPMEGGNWSHVDGPRRAGVSSFGVGGTNAHVVVEEAPEQPRGDEEACSHHLLCLSAKTQSALDAMGHQLADYLDNDVSARLSDVAHTLQVGRRQFECRRTLVVPDDVQVASKALREGDGDYSSNGTATQLIFLYPGQATQYPGMGKGLYDSFEICQRTIDRVADVVLRENPEIGDIRDLICWSQGHHLSQEEAAARLEQTACAQPAIFAVSAAVTELYREWGFAPSATMGHSIGEFAALVGAGVYSLEDAARLVTLRGKAMQAQPAGAMLAVRAPVEEVEKSLPPELSIAALNSPGVTVVSGPTEAIERYESSIVDADRPPVRLRTSHAFHSLMMSPVKGPLDQLAAEIAIGSARCAIYSSATGKPMELANLQNGYWGEQLISPVRFEEAVRRMANEHIDALFVEIGAGQVLTGLTTQILNTDESDRAIPTMRNPKEPTDDAHGVLAAVGKMWTQGIEIDWDHLSNGSGRRIPLPTYPFERKRYWVEPTRSTGASSSAAERVGSPAATEPTKAEQLVAQQLDLISAQINALSKQRGQR
ncbi:MAG: type I polyketide synthase [Parvularcula sp.]